MRRSLLLAIATLTLSAQTVGPPGPPGPTGPRGFHGLVGARGYRGLPGQITVIMGGNAPVTLGPATSLTITAGAGIILTGTTMADGSINLSVAVDTAVIQSAAVAQSGASNIAVSKSGSPTTYTAALVPTLTAYTPWMSLIWIPDVACIPPATLNVDLLGPIPLVERGSALLAPIDCMAGVPARVIFDGMNFQVF